MCDPMNDLRKARLDVLTAVVHDLQREMGRMRLAVSALQVAEPTQPEPTDGDIVAGLLDMLRKALIQVPARSFPRTTSDDGEEMLDLENFGLYAVEVKAGGDWQEPSILRFMYQSGAFWFASSRPL